MLGFRFHNLYATSNCISTVVNSVKKIPGSITNGDRQHPRLYFPNNVIGPES